MVHDIPPPSTAADAGADAGTSGAGAGAGAVNEWRHQTKHNKVKSPFQFLENVAKSLESDVTAAQQQQQQLSAEEQWTTLEAFYDQNPYVLDDGTVIPTSEYAPQSNLPTRCFSEIFFLMAEEETHPTPNKGTSTAAEAAATEAAVAAPAPTSPSAAGEAEDKLSTRSRAILIGVAGNLSCSSSSNRSYLDEHRNIRNDIGEVASVESQEVTYFFDVLNQQLQGHASYDNNVIGRKVSFPSVAFESLYYPSALPTVFFSNSCFFVVCDCRRDDVVRQRIIVYLFCLCFCFFWLIVTCVYIVQTTDGWIVRAYGVSLDGTNGFGDGKYKCGFGYGEVDQEVNSGPSCADHVGDTAAVTAAYASAAESHGEPEQHRYAVISHIEGFKFKNKFVKESELVQQLKGASSAEE
jgi:hypothetical protein